MTSFRALIAKPAFILTLVGIGALLPSFLWGPGATHSHLYNHMWTAHFGEQMAAGHLYERWLPNSFEGLGAPTFYFYPPLAYWVSGGLRALGLTIPQAINGAGLLLLVASGLTMHAWLSARGTYPLLGAILYMLAPYHLYNFHVRGALAEFAALIWLPLIALGIERLPHRRGLLLLALSYGALIITHLPLAVLTGVFLIGPLMARRIWQERTALPLGAAAGVIALGLSAFFLLPAATLQADISTGLLWGPGYRATDWSIYNTNFTMFTGPALALIILSWPARSVWTVQTVIGALAAVRLLPFVWDIPLLNKAQFPWRMMGIVEFTAITALLSCQLRRIRVALVGGAALLVFAYALMASRTLDALNHPVDYALIDRVMPDAPEYLPKGFDTSLVEKEYRWTDLRRFRTLPRGNEIAAKVPGRVTIHQADFPIWRVMRDGSPVPHEGPLISFDAQPGIYRIERVTVWQEKAGLAISILAVLLLMQVCKRGSLPFSDRRPTAPFSGCLPQQHSP
ncbi:YfhO family protein [Sphingobium fuliginis]|uniref:YfhO family protein n=1 Tax=Sphingobium fuliginis ATCC 27551 TaxID=1208342 RepID=A0A5B8CFZ3_SPHSA|nr:YfhO family protein [Sphingobium fuliginis]QDC38049.1 YfhO family protein [Sphingobium fuliginis ATCC 27551]